MKLNKKITTIVLTTALLLLALPGVAFAAGDGGGMMEILKIAVFQLLNMLILGAAMYYFGKKPLQKFLADRKASVTKELDEAKRLHEEARASLVSYKDKLDSLDDERDSILGEYRKMGERERDRIIKEARDQADKITRDAELTVNNELKRAKAALEAEVVTLATGMADKALREKLDKKAQSKLVDTYLGDLESQFDGT